jgi:ipoprotein LpqH
MTNGQGSPSRGRLILAIIAGVAVLLVVVLAIFVFTRGGGGGSSTTAATGTTSPQTSTSASSSTSKPSKTHSSSTESPSSSTSGSASAPPSGTAPAGTRVSVDGKDQKVDGAITCTTEGEHFKIKVGSKARVSLTTATPPTVSSVGIDDVDGADLTYKNKDKDKQGDAAVTVDGKTYKVTGHATGFDITDPFEDKSRAFEIDATCP